MIASLINIICLIAGFALGIVFFRLLKVNSEMYIINGLCWVGLALHFGRFMIAGLTFWAMSLNGALPLLFGFSGFLLGRIIYMKFMNKEKS